MKLPSVIVFDLDGVLFDTMPLVSDLHKQQYPGIDHQDVKELYKGNIHENLEKIAHKKSKDDLSKVYKNYEANKKQARMFSGMRDFIQKAANKASLVVNTSAVASNCVPLLEREGIDKCFSLIATKEMSPSKFEKFKIIAKHFNKESSDLLFITDTIGDVVEANAAEVPTILVTWGLHGKEDIDSQSYKYLIDVVDTVDELQNKICNK